jgi:hypothetical protein
MDSMLDQIEESMLREPVFHFRCHMCSSWKESFKTKQGLEEHLRGKHTLDLLECIQCLFCQETFGSVEEELEEYFEHMNDRHVKDLARTKMIWPAEDSECFSFVPAMSQLRELLTGSSSGNGTSRVGSGKVNEAHLDNEENMDEDSQSTKSSLPFSITNESSNKVCLNPIKPGILVEKDLGFISIFTKIAFLVTNLVYKSTYARKKFFFEFFG